MTDERGRFALPDVLPGRYTAAVRTPALDSVNVVHPVPLAVVREDSLVSIRVPSAAQVTRTLCGARQLEAPGIVVGTVTMRGDSVALPTGVKVVAEWSEEAEGAAADTAGAIARGALAAGGRRESAQSARDSIPTAALPERRTRWVETRADARGVFRLCGVPLETALAVRAEADSLGAEPVRLRIVGARTARADLVLDRAVSRAAVFRGLVLSDTTRRPIAGAEVVLPELQKAVLTNEDGAFRVADVPPGRYRVQVRRLGFGPLDTTVAFAANQTVERRIYLRRVVTLDSVNIVAERVVIPSFEEHRRIGLGHFLTRDELAKQEGRTLSSVLTQMPGVRVVQGTGKRAWIASSRGPRSLNPKCWEIEDGTAGINPCDCYAAVYVDKMLVSRSEIPNINRLAPSEIEAIEYYASPAQTPPEYSELNSPCGVVVIHTRKTP